MTRARSTAGTPATSEQAADRLSDRAAALHDRALDLLDGGDVRRAHAALARSRALFERACGPRHPDVANVLLALARIERDRGRVADAEQLGRRALAIMNPLRAGGDLPRLRVQAQAGLAETLCARGRYAEARALLRRALATAERRLGPGDLDTAAVLDLLGVVGKHSGRFDEAARAYRRAHRILARHPDAGTDLATLFHNLGGLEHARGRFARAEPLARRALEMRRHLLLPRHPQVAMEMAALAPIVDALGRHDEAAALLRPAIAIFRRAYGAESYDVAVGLHNLAASREAAGDHTGAERLYRRALAIKERLLGRRHPDTALTLLGLGALRARRADPAGARRLLRRALAVLTASVGASHPAAAGCREALRHLGAPPMR